MKKFGWPIFTIFLISFILFIFFFNFFQKRNVLGTPKIVLMGKKIVTINLGENYKEFGYKAFDTKDGNITGKVKILNEINSNKEGTYEIIYSVKNSDGILAKNNRFVKVISTPYYKDSYDKIDNTTRGWWATNKKDGSRPLGGADINELKKYNTFYMGPNKKIIYLTFDEGALETYVKEIVAVLDKNDVKATFFLCHTYMISNKDLIKNMVKSGHLIGNHTVNHQSMPSLANRDKFNDYLFEIKKMEDSYFKIVGKNMEKIYRDPRGEWSFRDLQIMKDLGYKNYFYSAYYMDFENDVSKDYALNELLSRIHNGAIYLIHPKNKGNLEAMDDFIKEVKKRGFIFDLVKNIH